MTDPQNGNNQQQPRPDPNDSVLDSLRGSSDPVVKALLQLADAYNRNPSTLRQRPPTRTSQTNAATSNWNFPRRIDRNAISRSTGSIISDVENGFKEALLDSLAGNDFKRGLQGALTEFTNQFGFQLKELPNQYGRYLGRQFANSGVGKALISKFEGLATNFFGKIFGKDSASAIIAAFKNAAGGAAGAGGGAAGAGIAGGSMANAQQMANANKLFGEISKFLKGAGGTAAAVAIFIIAMKPVFEGLSNFIKAWTAAFNRDEDIRKKRLNNAQERVKKDMEMLAKEPFNILIKAAEEWENTWDQNLAKISLTQGYTKENVYALYESVAKKLNSEGLGSVIPATDVINNLSKILDAGLSGAVAEAFAYESTWLSAAMPTEDFTGYAATYAQLASDAINSGLSQQEAIEYANLQLQEFASNLLYSSRTLSGGFTTGLKDAQSLFKNAVDIAQTAKTHNVSEISGTLTAVSGIIGAVAPDLAQGLVQNVVNAAIGGNETSIVALRSLAGINAGNTDFLRQMATNPQAVFEAIFRNLANMQNMSPGNYMEVAEGLSKVFGVDMKAFARVDFNLLADKISEMQVNQSSLEENLELLTTGQSVVSQEQLRYQEINNDILDNGLAYVIDSEYGRMIQQHMWDEQMANELAENEYAVNLQGAALSYLEGLRHTVANILNFLNPIGYIADGVQRMYATDNERKDNMSKIAEILELGKVGGGNLTAFNNLTNTTGQDLNLVRPLVELLGGSSYRSYTNGTWGSSKVSHAISGMFFGTGLPLMLMDMYNDKHPNSTQIPTSGAGWNQAIDEIGGMNALGWHGPGDLGTVSGTLGFDTIALGAHSRYSGFNVGKRAYSALTQGSANGAYVGSPIYESAEAEAFAANKERLQAYIDSAQAAAERGLTEAQYRALAESEYGISDLESELEEHGLTYESVMGRYNEFRSGIAGTVEENRKQNIQTFIEENRGFWDYTAGNSGIFQTAMWLPFFGDGNKYDTRMNAVDTALTDIQTRIGSYEKHTVISGIEELSRKIGEDTDYTVIGVLTQIESHINKAFIQSPFQQCLQDWLNYITSKEEYNDAIMNRSTAWSELKQAEGDAQNETLLALANAMKVFSAEELQKLDPQLQTNALLGQIVVILEAIMQQNNNSIGGFSLIDQLSALGTGTITR